MPHWPTNVEERSKFATLTFAKPQRCGTFRKGSRIRGRRRLRRDVGKNPSTPSDISAAPFLKPLTLFCFFRLSSCHVSFFLYISSQRFCYPTDCVFPVRNSSSICLYIFFSILAFRPIFSFLYFLYFFFSLQVQLDKYYIFEADI